METRIKNLFLLPVLIGGLGLMLAGRATAQTFTTLYSFTAVSGSFPYYTNSDGANPNASVILSGNTLSGTASRGGISGRGTLFAINTDGTGFTNLHRFTANPGPGFANSDGAYPNCGLISSGNTLYGTAITGGSSGYGTVFGVNTDGTGFTTLYSFTGGDDGDSPIAGVILSGNTLYGTALHGGSGSGGNLGSGTVFAVNTDGSGFTTLYSFTAVPDSPPYINSDGAFPGAELILSGNTLYGTASGGGSSGYGTVFAVNTDGTGFRTLYTFAGGSDGGQPSAGVILSGNTLYGTAGSTVFAVNTDGTGFRILHNFTALSNSYPYTNSDGAGPAGLILSGNTLYGTAGNGGSSGSGTVFAINTDGTGFTTRYSFTAANTTNSDGAGPRGLILSGNTFYGTTIFGGTSGSGTVFSLSLGPVSAPELTMIRSGANVILTWPTNSTGFTLQSTTNLVSPAVWTIVSPGPVVVNGHNAVTNAISGSQKFYRLSQ